MHCDLDLGDITFGQGHDTSLGCGQQLCEIVSISVKGLRSYSPDRIDGQTDRQRDRQTDGQTDREDDFVCGGYKKYYTKCPETVSD